MAVFELAPHLYTVNGFTSNVSRLREGIDSIRIMPGTDMGKELIDQKLTQSERLNDEFLEQQLRNAATFGHKLSSQEQNSYYTSITQLGQALATLPGTKAVVLFSGGFPVTRTWETAATGGLTPDFKVMLDVLGQYGIRFFTFDVGIEGGYVGADERTNFRMQLDQLGLGNEWLDDMQIGAQLDARHAHHEVLAVLGNETGGRFMRGNNFDRGLARVDEDLSHYYLIGYRPIDLQRIERYLKLNVEVEGYRGLKVVARHGRFVQEAQAQKEREEESRRAAMAALTKPLTLHARPVFYPAANGRTLVVLPVLAEGLGMTAKERAELPDKVPLKVRLRAQVSGITIEEMERDVMLPLGDAAVGKLEHGFALREAMVLPPTAFDVIVEVEAPKLSRLGRWQDTVRVPKVPLGEFGVRGLALLSPGNQTLGLYDVFRSKQPVPGTEPVRALADPMGDPRGRPPIVVDETVARDVPLLAQIGISAPPPPRADGQSPLRIDWELLPEGGGETLAPDVQYRRLELKPDGAWLDVVAQLDLTSVPAGRYSLRVSAAEIDSANFAHAEVPLVVR